MKKFTINKGFRPVINFPNKIVNADRMEVQPNGFTYFTAEDRGLIFALKTEEIHSVDVQSDES